MWHQSAIFENSWPLFCQIWIIFTHESQLQVGENSDWKIWRLKGWANAKEKLIKECIIKCTMNPNENNMLIV